MQTRKKNRFYPIENLFELLTFNKCSIDTGICWQKSAISRIFPLDSCLTAKLKSNKATPKNKNNIPQESP